MTAPASGRGGKADGLAWLAEAGESVPTFFTVGPGEDESVLLARFDELFDAARAVAVRSSAVGEDAHDSAQAGRYLTRLGVTRDGLAAAVADVLASIAGAGGSAVVQEQVPAELSAVVFTVNPLGLLNELVITVAEGTGTAVTDAVVAATTYVNLTDGQSWTDGPPGAPQLPEPLTAELVALGVRLQERAGHPLDLEVAVVGERLWVLQARPITALSNRPPVRLDSSNIVESYPGLTLPLSASFVPRAYRGVFRGLASRATGSARLVEGLDDVLGRMVVAHSGRLYYRIDHWYRVLQVMPFARSYLRVWQDSLGITERGYEEGGVALGRLQRAVVPVRLAWSLLRVPAGLRALRGQVGALRAEFPARLAACSTPDELRGLADDIEERLLAHWDVTLLNDLLAFGFPALVRGWLGLRGDPDPDGRARALVADAQLESLEPLRALARLAADLPADHPSWSPRQFAAFVEGPDGAGWRAYLDDYGDRGFAELKLETPTARTDPGRLRPLLAALGDRAEVPAPAVGLPADPVLRLLTRAARRAIAGRESSRLDRARVYGMVRAIALRAGEQAAAAGRLDEARDVFWLTWDEALPAEPDPAAAPDLRGVVAERRADYAGYALLPHYRRLVFAGEPWDRRPAGAVTPDDPGTAARPARLNGSGVSGGLVTGRVHLVGDPSADAVPAGRVLVTAMTDPGWVFLLAGAAAVITERGSPLSHTAIVARELGVPMVAGVSGATRLLAEGSLVEVNGTTGTIRVLEGEGP